MLIFHSWKFLFSLLDLFSQILLVLLLVAIIACAKAANKKWFYQPIFAPFMAMSIFHFMWHGLVNIFSLDLEMPRWLIWLELMFFLIQFIAIFCKFKKIGKGLWITFFYSSIFFILNLGIEVTAQSVGLGLIVLIILTTILNKLKA